MRYMPLIIIALSLFSCATISDIDGPLATESSKKYSNVTEFPKYNSDELYVFVQKWAVDAFNDPNEVVQFQDKSSGIIKGKYISTYINKNYVYNTRTTLTVSVKNGKIKMEFENPSIQLYSDKLGTIYNKEFMPVRKAKVVLHMRKEWQRMEQSLLNEINEEFNW